MPPCRHPPSPAGAVAVVVLMGCLVLVISEGDGASSSGRAATWGLCVWRRTGAISAKAFTFKSDTGLKISFFQ
ncbi:hypothetical protein PF005_g5111 [Phytophthora fragariae]|uniref:Uncharacterized protein n=1 Tax=Phytophthora fragariae TaxID=53985 RepID=A0A6A3U2P1_9STRA|nr:hypothetical protein PF003_g40694 [Phytophthora fragariae]KAE8944509.1 hypothetical protein PF009_g5810 [Phytophthora fragariae]KAE9025180.1 hypothetical protein PF011_g3138 [Phytophthora fragariae]KAE9130122.1 hypothetical protein PF007_g4640 [Phytophthora fragariae]KAE9145423.1 hypothetical protein PF006_g9719 [Phytophthora fragariae]